MSADGRLINVGGAPRRDLAVASTEPRLGPAPGAHGGRKGRSPPRSRPERAGPSSGPERKTTFGSGSRASLVIFAGTGAPRLAWRVLLSVDSGHVYDAVVDSTSGELLFRRNLVQHATGLAFDNYPGAPAGGTQTVKNFDPWLTATNRLYGNYAHVHADPNDTYYTSVAGPVPSGADEIPPAGGNWNYVHDAAPRRDRPELPARRL